MKRLLAVAIVIALGAGAAQAKTAYCQDPTTHKRISCKAVGAVPAPATTIAAATKPAASAMAPAKAPAPTKPVVSAAPAMSKAPVASASTGGAPHCTTGKACGHSCIAKDKVCHKPS